jgi:HEAT repeat protein
MNHLRPPVRLGLCAVAVLLAIVPSRADDPPKAGEKLDLDELVPHPDLDWLKRAKAPTDDAGLARFLDGLRGQEADPAAVERLVRTLAVGTKDEAEAAAKALTDLGAVAVPVLRRHRLDPDPAGAARVRACLEKIEEAADKPLARPAMRRLVMRKAPGAAEALLGYVPFAFDPAAAEDAWYGLDELAAKDPKALATLAAALTDKQPARRAVAACILGRRGDATRKAAVRGLLKDPDPEVRLRAAQGLLAGRDTAGVPALIDLLADPAVEVRWQAEELLRWLAVDSAPEAVVGAGDAKAAEACQTAWRKWWKDQGEKADVAAAEREPRRPLLLLAYARKDGRAWMVGCDGVTRHAWPGLDRLADAQYVPGGSVLTLHEQPVREKPQLAERDWSGKPLWQYDDMRDPASIQRLPNGQVFVAERKTIEPKLWYQVVAAFGKKVSERPAGLNSLPFAFAVRQLPDGKVLCARVPDPDRRPSIASLFELDPQADSYRYIGLKEELNLVDRIQAEQTGNGYLFSRLRDDIPSVADKTIIEIAHDGFELWSYRLTGAAHAAPLPGGNISTCVLDRLVEITRDKRMVGDVPCDHWLSAARPCMGLVRLGFETRPDNLDLAISADAWVRRLGSPRPKMRAFALERLADLGPKSAGAVPRIRRAMSDADPTVRESASRAFRASGGEVVPAALADLKNARPEVRVKALEVIGRYYRYPGVLDAVIAATRDGDRMVRIRAVGIFAGIADNPNSITYYDLSPSIWAGAADQVVPALIAASQDADRDIRGVAYMGMRALGPAAKAAVPQLLNSWKAADTIDRCRIATALGKIGPVSDEILPLLYGALAPSNAPELRHTAASALKYIGPPAKEAVPKLIDLYRDPATPDRRRYAGIQSACVVALARIAPDDDRVIGLFLSALSDEKLGPSERATVEEMLVGMGPKVAAQVLPVLDRLSRARDHEPNEFSDTAQKIRHRLRAGQ